MFPHFFVIFVFSYILNPCNSFSLNFTSDPILVGSAKLNQRFWFPRRSVKISDNVFALQVRTNVQLCDDNGKHGLPECTYAIAFSTDGGKTFQTTEKGADSFCGPQGIIQSSPSRLVCMKHQRDQQHNRIENEITFKTIKYSFENEKLTLSEDENEEVIRFKIDSNIDFKADEDLFFTDGYLPITENVLYRTLSDGIRFFSFRSEDGGWNWKNQGLILSDKNLTAVLPTPFPKSHSLIRWGEKKILFSLNGFSQSISNDMGKTWNKPDASIFPLPVRNERCEHGTGIYTGLKKQPGVSMIAVGSGKGSERPYNIALMHNGKLKFSGNPDGLKLYHDDYLNATEFDCLGVDTPSPSKGCQSTSVVDFLQIEPNRFLVFYDRVSDSGYEKTIENDPDHLYTMTMEMDETKEKKAADLHREKVEYERKIEEQNQKRMREARREKRRKEQERRDEWAQKDVVFKENAKIQQKKLGDGEHIVVRDVEESWKDMEDEYL